MIKRSALRVLEIEQRAIAQLAQYIDDAFVEACQLILPVSYTHLTLPTICSV